MLSVNPIAPTSKKLFHSAGLLGPNHKKKCCNEIVTKIVWKIVWKIATKILPKSYNKKIKESVVDTYTKLKGGVKLDNVWVLVQLIFGPPWSKNNSK